MRNTIIVPVLRVLVILILAVLAFMPSCNAQVYFNTASAEVSAEGQAALINVANDLIANPSRRIQLIGYTDPRGSEAYNLDLASRRCNAVRSILIGLGVDSARILILPFGEDVNAATLKEGRRVEMHGFSTEFGEGDQTSTNATLEMDSTSNRLP
jgi:outer membrane protein OmpA-like peptidoglycan-associated protein